MTTIVDSSLRLHKVQRSSFKVGDLETRILRLFKLDDCGTSKRRNGGQEHKSLAILWRNSCTSHLRKLMKRAILAHLSSHTVGLFVLISFGTSRFSGLNFQYGYSSPKNGFPDGCILSTTRNSETASARLRYRISTRFEQVR